MSAVRNRERFERELCRLRGYRFKRLLVIGSEDDIRAGRYHSKISPASVLGTLAAFKCRYDCPVVIAANRPGSVGTRGWVSVATEPCKMRLPIAPGTRCQP
jgi:hypothetical protein